jgi:hypothetical protein
VSISIRGDLARPNSDVPVDLRELAELVDRAEK